MKYSNIYSHDGQFYWMSETLGRYAGDRTIWVIQIDEPTNCDEILIYATDYLRGSYTEEHDIENSAGTYDLDKTLDYTPIEEDKLFRQTKFITRSTKILDDLSYFKSESRCIGDLWKNVNGDPQLLYELENLVIKTTSNHITFGVAWADQDDLFLRYNYSAIKNSILLAIDNIEEMSCQ